MPLYPPATPGVTDHGALTGLTDDDHPQYATNTEFDDHSARHENGGADEISIAGLDGTPAELTTHAGAADPHTGYLLESLIDAKGDLIAASAADTPARLAVAANGASLRAASGQATGLEWQLNNLAAAVAPTVNEDSGDGYSVGSRWIDTTADKEYVCLDASVGAAVWTETTGAGGGAPTTADYLVGTAQGGLSAEIVVGATPGGELGGTWGTPTVDATHSGSAHADFIAKAIVDAKGDLIAATAADTVARLAVGTDSHVLTADSAEATGLKWAPASGSGIPATIFDAAGDIIVASAADTAAVLTAGANGAFLQTLSTEAAGLIWRAAPTFAVYKRTAGNYTTTSGTFVDVDATNLALTITTLARRVRISLVASGLINTVNAFLYVDVDLDGARLGGDNGIIIQREDSAATSRYRNMSFSWITDVLTAASHTFKLQWKVSAGTGTLVGSSADSVLQFSVEETFLTA
jgi:hypothetical protein